ncbi:hypothetical protein HHI36_020827 [Cryptolaemus montrouzieri]|uniref:Uncharacterized protein n=1 Tax=Cryptolaemus montrouzieri TaxID=559131 RepID=A0ABD2NBW3_9CUCU
MLEIGNLNEIIYGNVKDTELEDNKTFLDGFVEDNKKIWDRNSFLEYEKSRDLNIDNDEQEAKNLKNGRKILTMNLLRLTRTVGRTR